jgi:hypothetical protein
MSKEIVFKIKKGRNSYIEIGLINYFYLIPSSFKKTWFKGTQKSHCKWYLSVKFYWLFFRFYWIIKSNKKPKL